jgi:maleylacetoacetate isomerase
MPTDPLDRARVRAVAYAIAIAIAMKIHPVCNLRVARFAVEKSAGTLTMQGWMREFISPGLVAVERMIDGGPTCLGVRVSLADLCLFPQIYNAQRWDVDLGGLPKIQRVIGHLSQIP